MFSHNLSLPSVLTLWSSFYSLIMHRPLHLKNLVAQTTLWNNLHRFDYIDNALVTEEFKTFICQCSPNGFRRYFYSSSDDSEHHQRNHHVLIISRDDSGDINNIQPSFRHVTSSVSGVKSGSAQKNVSDLISCLV